MSLIFCETQNQALLAFVIKIATDSGKKVGRTAVQKILYFLSVRKIRISYKFDIHHYGPFCEQILWDLELLLADGVIEDLSSNPQTYSAYSPSTSVEELLQMHQDFLGNSRPVVEQVVTTLAGLKPAELELIATLDYLFRQQKATGTEENLKTSVVRRFQEIKKEKFSIELINKTYDTMVAANFVSS